MSAHGYDTPTRTGANLTEPSTLPSEVWAFIWTHPSTTHFDVCEKFALNPMRDRERVMKAIDAARTAARSNGGAARGGAEE